MPLDPAYKAGLAVHVPVKAGGMLFVKLPLPVPGAPGRERRDLLFPIEIVEEPLFNIDPVKFLKRQE